MPEPRLEPGSTLWRATLLRLSESSADEDLSSLAAVVRANPTRADALLALSLALTSAGRDAAAGEALRRARFLDPAVPNTASPESVREALLTQLGARPRDPTGEASPEPLAAASLLPVAIQEDGPADEPGNPDETESDPSFECRPVRPFAAASALPDALIVAQQSLDLYLRRIVKWAAPLAVLNVGACLVRAGGSPLTQALPWTLAMAAAAPLILKAMAREWAPQSPAFASWPRLGSGQLWAGFLVLAAAFAGLMPSTVFRWLNGADVVAVGLLIWLPLLGLLAPALMILVTQEGATVERPPALSLLLERGPVHAGVVTTVGSLGVLLLGSLGWGFLEALNIGDEPARRLMFGVGASVPQSLVLALVAGCGMEAVNGHGASRSDNAGFV